MTILKTYAQFDGRHWETGSVHNVLAYQGVKAPHTGQPLSEALLLGISGGITFGYFTFKYKGYDPHVAMLTRNTFDPLQTLLERLGIVQTVIQTMDEHKARKNLQEVLADGRPAIVWADAFSLPYNGLAYEKMNWIMWPVVVFGYADEQIYIADRSSQPFVVAADEFSKARARVKKEKFRIIALDPPEMQKLPAAILKGLWQCIQLYSEAPPRGTTKNFGLSGLKYWAEMLTNSRNPQSWARFFPPGSALWAALVGVGAQPGLFSWILAWGDGGAERRRQADFLDEAAELLKKPGLKLAAERFRQSHSLWQELGKVALPDEVDLFRQARGLLVKRQLFFVEKGQAALPDILQINQELRSLRTAALATFPLSVGETADLCRRMSAVILEIQAVEQQAVEAMQSAIS